MNRRILLIDADPAFRASLDTHLGRYRFEIYAEAEADKAIAAAASVSSAPTELTIVAVEEPDKAGFKVFQRLKKGPLGKKPIMLVTGSVSADSFAKHATLKVRADAYLDKRTFSKDELLGKIDNLVDLGEMADDDLDIPVEDGFAGTGAGLPGTSDGSERGGPSNQVVAAEVDSAFDFLTGGGFADAAAHEAMTDAITDAPPPVDASTQIDEDSSTEISVVTDAIPGAVIHDGTPHIEDDAFEAPRHSASAIELRPDDLLDASDHDSGGVPEPVPHPMGMHDDEGSDEAPAIRESRPPEPPPPLPQAASLPAPAPA
ncbi:MAG: response regulator, partial [Deltaproteobacteria bacterium]|nr:response regulator [Deltaproteobacteria bacterium]